MRPNNQEVYTRLIILRCVVVHALATSHKSILTESFAQWSEEDRRNFDELFKAPAEAYVVSMRESGLWKYTSPNEQAFLQSYGSKVDEYANKAASWRIECAGMLMWALGLTSWPKIDEEISYDLLKDIPLIKISLFSKYPQLRPKQEISHKRDLIEFWHWRVRTRRLIEEGYPFKADEYMNKELGLNSFDDIVRASAKIGYERGDLPEIIDEDFVFLGKPFRLLTNEEYQRAASIIMERHYALNWLSGKAPGNRWDETPTDT